MEGIDLISAGSSRDPIRSSVETPPDNTGLTPEVIAVTLKTAVKSRIVSKPSNIGG